MVVQTIKLDCCRQDFSIVIFLFSTKVIFFKVFVYLISIIPGISPIKKLLIALATVSSERSIKAIIENMN